MNTTRERELPYAWVIVALTFFALAVAMGIRSTIGLLVHPWENEFGWDRAAVSLTASFGFLVYGLAQPVAGRWADRYGPRLVFSGSLALLGLSTAAVGIIQNLWQAYLVFGVGLMAAVGGASNVPAAVAIARWIKRRKALAVGIVMAGAAAGQLVLVPAFAAFMKAWGWRAAFVWSGLGVLLIALPLVLIFLKDDPPGGAEVRAARERADGRPLPLAEILRQRNFWWLMGSFWVCGVTTAGLIDPHLIPYAEDIHIDTVTAATAFGVLGTFNVLGTLFAGAISDRWGHRWVLGWVYAGRALTLILLLFVREPVMLCLRRRLRDRGLRHGPSHHGPLHHALRPALRRHRDRSGLAEPPGRVCRGLLRRRVGPRLGGKLRTLLPGRGTPLRRRGGHELGYCRGTGGPGRHVPHVA
jgi:MFS family permease